MPEIKKYKAIHFDLSTKALKKHYDKSRTNAYREIEKFLKENGFAHRQWSGYVSKEKLDSMDIMVLNERMWQKFPWLEQCAKRLDVTDVGKRFDLIHVHKEQEKEKSAREYPAKQNNKEVGMNMSQWQAALESGGSISVENKIENIKDIERE